MRAIPVFFVLAGCNGEGTDTDDVADEPEIADTPLAGLISGSAWTFVAGGTDAFLSDEDGFFTSLYGEDVDPCGFPSTAQPKLLVSLPTAVGPAQAFSMTRNATFVVQEAEGTANYVAFDGAVRIDELTDTTISGGLRAVYDADFHEVDGLFTVQICPE